MCSPTIRAPTSVAPPGANGTMMVTGRVGYACALATRDTTGRAAVPAAKCRNRRRPSRCGGCPASSLTDPDVQFPASGSSWESLARGGVDDTIRDSSGKKSREGGCPLRCVPASTAIRCRFVDRFVRHKVLSHVSRQRFSPHGTPLSSIGSEAPAPYSPSTPAAQWCVSQSIAITLLIPSSVSGTYMSAMPRNWMPWRNPIDGEDDLLLRQPHDQRVVGVVLADVVQLGVSPFNIRR
jgi:hypothetical protein